jgi:hypothetical protein
VYISVKLCFAKFVIFSHFVLRAGNGYHFGKVPARNANAEGFL